MFNGAGGTFPSGAFVERGEAETWISQRRLSGVLTKYPLNTGVYDWAVKLGYFTPKKAEHSAPDFVGKFSSASLEHFHYEDGPLD